MKKIIFILLLILNYSLKAQNDTILYVFPDSVEKTTYNYINSYKKQNKKTKFYLILSSDNDKTYCISIAPYIIGSNKDFDWIFTSNRKTIIKKDLYPLIFLLDQQFATTDKNNIASMGNRNGNIKKVYIKGDFYKIKFDRDGKILKKGYF